MPELARRVEGCMRLSHEFYSMINSSSAAHRKALDPHFSADLLWDLVMQRLPLDAARTNHADECRDCRQFVEEFSIEAREAGFSFPDLLPEGTDRLTA